MDKLIIDAKDLIVGRLGTKVATMALHGQEIVILNCEKAALSGSKPYLVGAWRRKFSMGVPRKGPFIDRYPDRFVRRIIRGMFPRNAARGRDAYKRVMCYIGVPAQFKDAKTITFDEAHVRHLPSGRFMTVGEICKELGGKWYE